MLHVVLAWNLVVVALLDLHETPRDKRVPDRGWKQTTEDTNDGNSRKISDVGDHKHMWRHV